jgi:CheY-like chemotaxis protein
MAEPVITAPVIAVPIAEESAVTGPPVPTAEPRRPTILLVEDDPDVRRMVQRMLERGGMRVVSVETGLEALARWQDIAPVDLVLTDLVMPGGMSGIEMAHDLQSLAPGLRVVYTSGYDPEYDSHGGLLEPGVNFIPKPASADTILAVIRRQLGDGWDLA